jgi:hypothetical protein
MGMCGSCQANAVSTAMPSPLFQIRRGFRTDWCHLILSVERESGNWTLRVRDSAEEKNMYTAYRSRMIKKVMQHYTRQPRQTFASRLDLRVRPG